MIYHVAKGWDGGDLRSLARQVDDGDLGLDEAIEMVDAKWGFNSLRQAEAYLDSDGRQVHCHATLGEAIDFRDEWCPGGVILSIDPTDLNVSLGSEYPHPIVAEIIPAGCIAEIES